jgi:hypothetical protein
MFKWGLIKHDIFMFIGLYGRIILVKGSGCTFDNHCKKFRFLSYESQNFVSS